METLNKKIIWPLDIYENDFTIDYRVFSYIKFYADTIKAEVIPTFILSPRSTRLGLSFLIEPHLESFKKQAKENFEKSLNRLKGHNFSKPEVIISKSNSLNKNIDDLVTFAKKNDVDLIITSNHRKSSLKTFALGSFTEGLLSRSSIPLLTINPDSEIQSKIKRILHPTTFDEKSKEVFEKTLSIAKLFGAEISLLNIVTNNNAAYISPYYLNNDLLNLIEDSSKKERARIKKLADNWIQLSNESGVNTSLKLIDDKEGVLDCIIDSSKEQNSDLIIMQSQVSKLEGIFFGSTTKQVIRTSSTPVWAIHS